MAQPQQVFVQYVDQYGNPIPVVPMGGQHPQQMTVVMPVEHNTSVVSAQSLHSNSAMSYEAPAPRQIPLQVQQPHNPAAPQNIANSIAIQQTIEADTRHKKKKKKHHKDDKVANLTTSSDQHKRSYCCLFQCTQSTVWICKNRFCGDECCRPHEEQHCFRPGGNNDCDCLCCLIYLALLCCVWESMYNCIIAGVCREENKWCCVPCDLFINLLIIIPLFFVAFVADLLCLLLALLACFLDPLCCLITCDGEFCKWKMCHNALCCLTLGWFQDTVKEPKDGCWEKECGDDCGYFYCYRLRCDNWTIC